MVRARPVVSVIAAAVILAVSASVAGAGSGPSGDARVWSLSSTRYVSAAVHDVLDRTANDDDYDRWAGPLDDGGTTTAFAASLVRRPERAAAVIDDLYYLALRRDPDPSGLAYWTGKLASGYRSANLAAALFSSREFYEGAGGRDDTYVKIVYLTILERPADPKGLDFWVRRIGAGQPRSVIARNFYLSTESNARRVTETYRHLLGRAPSALELRNWSKDLVTLDDNAMVAAIVAGDEYYLATQVRVPPTTTTSTTAVP